MGSEIKVTAQNRQVRDFYEDMPFNYYSDAAQALKGIKANPILNYHDLDAVLPDDSLKTVLEIGCGAGWASNSIAHHYGKRITAVDFTAKALERAKDVAQELGTADQINFVHSDLFKFQTAEKFDLVFSMGVLHHTNDCHAAFQHISQFVADDGLLYVGLYHSYGRRPFLEYFHNIVEAQGEDAAFARYCEINGHQQDSTHLRSWFRDQVLHPQETQHSLEEVIGWLDEAGFDLITTSINQFGEADDHAALFEQEKTFEAYSKQRNITESQYYPGFFTVMAERR